MKSLWIKYSSGKANYQIVRDILAFFYFIGILGLNIPVTRELYVQLTPLTLLLTFTILLYFHREWNGKFVFVSLTVAILGILIEAIGVHTKLIFGDYNYGPTLGLKVWDTPLMIGVNWLMLVYISYNFFYRKNWNVILKIVSGALVMVAYDIVLEPIAMDMKMWDWKNSIVPIQNYVAWFIIAALFISLFYSFKIRITNKISSSIYFIQLVFFLVLNIIHITKRFFPI